MDLGATSNCGGSGKERSNSLVSSSTPPSPAGPRATLLSPLASTLTSAAAGAVQLLSSSIKAATTGKTPKPRGSRRQSLLPGLVKEGDIRALEEEVQRRPNLLEEKDLDKRTALIVAAEVGDVRAVQVLLEAGADVTAKDRRQMDALLAAAGRGHRAVLELLIDVGRADVNGRGYGGRTALHEVSALGSLPCVASLLERRADPCVVDMQGVSPLMGEAASTQAGRQGRGGLALTR